MINNRKPDKPNVKPVDSIREQDLQALRIRYQALFENSMDAILLTEPNGGILAANPAACEMFKRSEKEICQLGRNALVDVTDPRLENAIKERLRTGKFKGELTYVRKDGSKFPGEVSSVIFEDADGNLRTSMIIRDISERKQVEQAMQKSEEKWRSLYDILPVGVSIVSQKDDVIEFNRALAEILDYSPEELSRGVFRSRRYFRSDNSPMPEEEFPSLVALRENKRVKAIEIGIEKEDGLYKWTSVSAAPFADGSGTVTVTVDITELKKIEEALRESEKNLLHAEQIAHVGYWSRDMVSGKINLSDESYRIFGLEDKSIEITLESFIAMIHPEDRNKFKQAGQDAMLEIHPFDLEFRILRPDGSVHWVYSKGEFSYNLDRQPIRCVRDRL
jgi:PAS domain S-box-containing protein